MLPDLLIGLAIFVLCAAILLKGVRNRRAGKGGCSCGGTCGSCSCSGLCHPQSQQKP